MRSHLELWLPDGYIARNLDFGHDSICRVTHRLEIKRLGIRGRVRVWWPARSSKSCLYRRIRRLCRLRRNLRHFAC